MATQKPTLLPYTWANVVKDIDDPQYSEIVERPPVSKFESGWEFGEKPKHQYFNYGWKQIDDYLHHVNSFGIPIWDKETLYEVGSITLYLPYLYKATVQNQDSEPSDTNTDWELIGQTLENLGDTASPYPSDDTKKYILVWDGSVWDYQDVTTVVSNLSIDTLSDVHIEDKKDEQVLAYNEETNLWSNYTLRDATKLDIASSFTVAKDVQYKQPTENNILKFNGNIWKIEDNLASTGTWSKILNKPNEYNVPYATKDVFGGAKIYSAGSTLYIETKPSTSPDAPRNCKTISSPQEITVFWSPSNTGENANYYKVFRDELEIQSGILDTIYDDGNVERDREYVYFVKGTNIFGDSLESNRVIGHTFSEPSKPRNLSYTIQGTDVILRWEEPETISGNIEYHIYKDNTFLESTFSLSYTDKNVSIGNYTYYVVAKNKYYQSENSNSVFVIKQ